MTYGWALILIATIIGMLVFMIDPATSTYKCKTFDSLIPTFICKGATRENDKLFVTLQNITGYSITLDPYEDIAFDGKTHLAVINYGNETYRFGDITIPKGATFTIEGSGAALTDTVSVTYTDTTELEEQDRAMLFERFGKTIDSLGGKYIAAEDIGTTEQDMASARKATPFVTGVPGEAGNPSPVTAFGVFRGMQACCQHSFGSESLKGKTIAVQGIGNVGFSLLPHLNKSGASIVVADVNNARVEKAKTLFNAKAVAPEEIFDIDCDIFAPCAFGETINKKTVKRLKCSIVAGAANNQLASPEMGKTLFDQGFIYAPDYVINCGGLISVANEKVVTGTNYNKEEVMQRTAKTFDRILNVLKRSAEENQATHEIADKIAEERIAREGQNRQPSLHS